MVSAVAIMAAAAALAPFQDAVELRLGEALQVEQRADETRTFRINLEVGKAYLLEAEQRELDLIIEITGPDGESRSFDAPLLRFEPERLLIEPDSTGPLIVSMRSVQYKGRSVRYALQVQEVPVDRASDKLRRDALGAETSAAAANSAGGMENWTLAVDAYRLAATSWMAVEEVTAAARAQLAAARVLYAYLSDWDQAARDAQEAARLYRRAGDRNGIASALHVRGAVLIEAASEIQDPTTTDAAVETERPFNEGLANFGEAARIRDALGQDYERGRIENDIGLAHYTRGNWIAARHNFSVAAAALAVIQEWAEELKATANLATVDYAQGNLVQALRAYDRVLALMPADRTGALGRADLLDNMGAAHRALGNVDKALAYYMQALAEHEALESTSGRGRSLSRIGVTYLSTGELQLAREYLERALPIQKEARDGAGQVSTLLNLGRVYLQQGHVRRAIETHKKAAALSVTAGQRATAQVALGRDLAAAGDVDEALRLLAMARKTAEEAGTPVVVADALLESGRLLIVNGRSEQSAEELGAALAQYQALGWATGAAQALYGLAQASRSQGALMRASEYAAASVQQVEQLRGLIASSELRARYMASQREHFSLYIDIAIDLAFQSGEGERGIWIERALAMSERGRMRAMLDLLQEAAVGIGKTAVPDLAQKRAELYQELAGLRFRQQRLLERQRDPQALNQARMALSRVETELQVIDAEVRRRDPRYAAIAAPETLDAQAIKATLDDSSMLLQYELGDERSWLFVVTIGGIDVHPLPPRRAIDTIARRAHDFLQTLDADPTVRHQRNAALEEISRVLLEPARPLKKRLIIAADGALHYLPFAVLPLKVSGQPAQSLIELHEIVGVPSISVVAAQRRLLAGRPPAARTVAVFADPVFQEDDPRFDTPSATARIAPPPTSLLRTNRWSADALRRLPAAAVEVEAISGLVPSDDRLIATGFDASKRAVLGSDLNDFKIIHFATHALVDDRYPALSALALSRFDSSRMPLDPLIHLHDVYNLELGADLVTLSACQTALGRELRGEGLVGLTHGFIYAGGRSVVASLWQVPDRAVAELMRHFYERQLLDGLSPAAALREAQLSLRATRAWQDPFYWAAFLLHGEWHRLRTVAHIYAGE